MKDLFYKKVLVITDKALMVEKFLQALSENGIDGTLFDFAHSPGNSHIADECTKVKLMEVKVKELSAHITGHYDMLISLHCQQVFPPEVVNNIKCINIHPGYNPYNRGWYPHIFAIIDGSPAGATIHEIDENIDSGPIICREMITIEADDTSTEVYKKTLDAEYKLMKSYLPSILKDDYKTFLPEETGSYHSKKDFYNLLELNPEKEMKAEQFINYLRALSHEDYNNVWYKEPKSGKKIYLKLNLESEG